MRIDQPLLLPVLLSILACSGPTSVTEDDFTLRATGREVVLSNAAARPTFYVIVERGTAAYIDLSACVDEVNCRHVASGTTVRLPYSGIDGYRPGKRQAIVYWWRSLPSPSGPEADSVRTTVMKL